MLVSQRVSNSGQMDQCHFCSTKNNVSNINKQWVEAYLRAALEVDGQKMPERIVVAREAVAGRLKDLEGNRDHHAERHEMQSALAALTSLEDETGIWPTTAIAHSMATLLPKLRHKNAANGAGMTSSGKKDKDMTPTAKPSIPALRKAPQPPLSHPGATPDVDRAKRPPLVKPSATGEELNPGDRVEGLGNFGKPTGEIGTVERTNENDAVVKWDDDGRVRVGQPWLKRI
jgi:hypothetical protein